VYFGDDEILVDRDDHLNVVGIGGASHENSTGLDEIVGAAA
jgi:hypothetical protein